MAKTLVFLEHHDGAIAKGSLGVLAKAAQSAARSPACSSARVCERSRDGAGAFGATTVWVADDARSARRCRSRASTCSRQLVRDEGYDTVLFAQSVLAADIAGGTRRTARRRAQLGARRLRRRDPARRRSSPTRCIVDVGWSSDVRLAIFRAGAFDAERVGGSAEVEGRGGRAGGLLDARPRWSSRRMPSSRGRRSRTPT